MSDVRIFRPSRRLGLLFHVALILLIVGGGLWGLLKASRAEVGPAFLFYLLPAFIAAVLAPILAYRVYCLYGAVYAVERNGITLRWGLRSEQIPMDIVEWVHPASELEGHLPLPLMRFPGYTGGTRRLGDGSTIEFMAAHADGLVLIATPGRIFAISPDPVEDFMHTFQRLTELGSLSPLPARSVYPALLLSRIWADPPARYLLISGILLNLALLVWVSLAIPGREQISLRLAADGSGLEYIPAVQLLLLPVLNGLFFTTDLLLGLFFYRRTVDQPSTWHAEHTLSYLLWAAGAVTPALFLAAVYFVTSAG